MGKTSLIGRTVRELRRRGISCASIDFQPFPTEDVHSAAFYYAIAHELVGGLCAGFDLGSWWDANSRLDCLHRLSLLFVDVVFSRIKGPVVVFLDEVDWTTQLPFSDDFFGWIRSCRTARPTKEIWRRVSFVLVGTADPAKFIKDRKRTPYNIGTRVVLEDFRLQEMSPFVKALAGHGVRDPERVLAHVYDWTAGHPYLTQKICAAIEGETQLEWTRDDIERLVERLFLLEEARDEVNLQSIRDMIEQRSPDRTEAIQTYGTVCRGETVDDDERDPIKNFLKLCGLVRREGGQLRVRNRIYATVFDLIWVQQQLAEAGLPPREVRRYVESLPVLQGVDYRDVNHWRWVLEDAHGKFLADHSVALDPAHPLYPALLDLRAYLAHYASPDHRTADETRLLQEIGAWLGEQVLGKVGLAILKYGTPVTVRVLLPPEAEALLQRPLELAHANGQPLALQDVSLVFEVVGENPPVRPKPMGNRLRMLAVFSLPTDASALALRRERYELKKRMERIAQTHGLAVELRVLQYGATRQALREALEEGEGWDVIHLSGHGLAGAFALERADGSRDLILSRDLHKLLRPARGRIKLVTLSSCFSAAAATVEQTLRLLGIQPTAAAGPAQPVADAAELATAPAAVQPLPAMARALVQDLDCAVLAMRYPVGDDFALRYCGELYEHLLGRGQLLPRAAQTALMDALGGADGLGSPPLSVATPALFGRRAVGLMIRAPPLAETDFPPAAAGLAYFPPEPTRFVGRVGPMARASAALAPQSGKTGVLFYGMAGAGKTACALELAYRYETGRFQGCVWYKAPDEGKEIDTALRDLALAMETQLPNFAMVHVVDRADELVAWLPRLKKLLETNSLLLVLDNLESLLTADGQWRDERWQGLLETLLGHSGLSRTVLTSRRLPAGLEKHPGVRREAIHALSLDEAVLLARELPNLGRLLEGTHPALRGTAGEAQGRTLFARSVNVVQGHPKLLELADKLAADPAVLGQRLEQAEGAWQGGTGTLGAFFATGQSEAGEEEFLRALADWTHGLAATLPAAARMLFGLLCCLEEGDRQSGVVGPVWPELWKKLPSPTASQPAPTESGGGEQAPDLSAALAALTRCGLVEEARWEQADDLGSPYRLHPGVAEAGRAAAGAGFQEAVDKELADFWWAVYRMSVEQEMKGGGAMLVHAGRSAAPYLLRLRRWGDASALLEEVICRDVSRGTLAGVLPWLRRIAHETRGTQRELIDAGVLASALLRAGRWREAEGMLREIMPSAAQGGKWRQASANAGDLVNLLRDSGRAEEALGVVGEMQEYTRRAGLGPWTQLGDEARRLQLLNALGRYDQVRARVEELRGRMKELPEQSAQEEAVEPWNAREGILDAGRTASLCLQRWEEALALNAEIVQVTQARGAPPLELARTRANDYGPLLRLRRYVQARELLDGCRVAFEAEGAVSDLGKIFSGLADLEDKLGHREPAVAFQETSLRYTNLAGDPEDCASSHHNLSIYLKRAGRERKLYLAHRLAAGVIFLQISSGNLATLVRNLAIDLAEFAPQLPPFPASFEELCGIVEQVDGVRLRELFARLPKKAEDGDAAMRTVIEMAGKAGAGSG